MASMTQRDRELLDTPRRRTEQAENEGDVSFFEGVSARNIVLMPPNFRAVVGRAASIDFMRHLFVQFDFRIRYQSEELQVYDDVAFDRGTYSQTLTPKSGGSPLDESGNYLWIYSRGDAESWKVSRVMWNATSGG
jgi:ketosteroid isomerase-like protein